jgi:hypothetical protein
MKRKFVQINDSGKLEDVLTEEQEEEGDFENFVTKEDKKKCLDFYYINGGSCEIQEMVKLDKDFFPTLIEVFPESSIILDLACDHTFDFSDLLGIAIALGHLHCFGSHRFGYGRKNGVPFAEPIGPGARGPLLGSPCIGSQSEFSKQFIEDKKQNVENHIVIDTLYVGSKYASRRVVFYDRRVKLASKFGATSPTRFGIETRVKGFGKEQLLKCFRNFWSDETCYWRASFFLRNLNEQLVVLTVQRYDKCKKK